MKEKHGDKEPSWQNKLRSKIDEILPKCNSFDDFLLAMKTDGYQVNNKRKHITFLAVGQKQPTCLNTLKGDHTEESIRRRIEEYKAAKKLKSSVDSFGLKYTVSDTIKVSWLINIQAKIQEGKGAGYEHFAHLFNIKEMAKTLMYLKEQDVDSYEELVEKSTVASTIATNIKAIEIRQKEIVELQRQIGTYGKTRDILQSI